MVAPLAIAAGAMVIGSLVQLYNGEKARGADAKRLKEIEGLFNEIKPPDYDLSIIDPPELHEDMLALPEFSSSQAAPKFNLQNLDPKKLELVGKYVPEVAPYIAEERPELIQQTEGMRTGRDAQLNALRRFMEVGAGEFDPEYQQKVTEASRSAQADAQSRQASILQDFARRGQSGSGLALAAQMGGASQAMDRQAMANMSAASDAYRNRLDSLAQGANLGGQIASEDINLQGRNNDVINSFNQRMSSGYQNYLQQRAAQLNDAQQYNLGVQQNLSNINTQTQNEASASGQRRLDDLAKYSHSANTDAQARQDSLAKWGYDQKAQERNYQNQLAMSKYGIKTSERDHQNDLKTRQFQNEMSKAGGRSGVSNQIGAANMSAAQDRNNAIQGLSNVAMTYAQGAQADNRATASQLASDDRAQYEKTGSYMSPEEREKRKSSYADYY